MGESTCATANVAAASVKVKICNEHTVCEMVLMDDVIDDLMRTARRCERASKRFDDPAFKELIDRLKAAIDSVGSAASGSCVGYHSRVYTLGLRPKRPGEHFDMEWGPPDDTSYYTNRTRGEWVEFTNDAVRAETLSRAGANAGDLENLAGLAVVVEEVFDECKSDLLPTLDAVLRSQDDAQLREVRDTIAAMESRITQSEIVLSMMPKGEIMTRDTRAIQGGIQSPPHVAFEGWLIEQRSTSLQAKALADQARYAAKYLQKAMKMKGKTVAKTDGPIFIGHGRAHVWKDLREFLSSRLGLQHEEFNREPPAGRSNKERILELLDMCPFAFIVMTAEDEHNDGTVHPRANVIHEAGLFQGRYGFERAIILLEEGCEEFSNAHGIGQIRFPKGNIEAKCEEIRRVLEREGLL